jgi:hypothetical protein
MGKIIATRIITAAWVVLFGSGLMAREGQSIRVPEGNGKPILIDGIFTPGEWDDALSVEVRPGLQVLLKKSDGFVFLGAKFTKFDVHGWHGSIDVFISPDGRSIRQLHAGAQLGERRLNETPDPGDDPPFEWGNTSDWYANEDRWSERKFEALMKEGKSRLEAQLMSFYKSEGFELQIRQSKFGSDEWYIRLRSSNPADGTREFHPKGSDAVSTAGWYRLLLK